MSDDQAGCKTLLHVLLHLHVQFFTMTNQLSKVHHSTHIIKSQTKGKSVGCIELLYPCSHLQQLVNFYEYIFNCTLNLFVTSYCCQCCKANNIITKGHSQNEELCRSPAYILYVLYTPDSIFKHAKVSRIKSNAQDYIALSISLVCVCVC